VSPAGGFQSLYPVAVATTITSSHYLNMNYLQERAESQLQSVIELASCLNWAESGETIEELQARDPETAATIIEALEPYGDIEEFQGNSDAVVNVINQNYSWQKLDPRDFPRSKREYQIVLTNFGAHVKITGKLDEYNNPTTAKLRYLWSNKSGELDVLGKELEALKDFTQRLYFTKLTNTNQHA
jgi:hypothetical protein